MRDTKRPSRGVGIEMAGGFVRAAACGHLCLRWGREHKCCGCRGNKSPCRVCAKRGEQLGREPT